MLDRFCLMPMPASQMQQPDHGTKDRGTTGLPNQKTTGPEDQGARGPQDQGT